MRLAFCALVTGVLAGCTTTPSTPTPFATGDGDREETALRVGDQLVVRLDTGVQAPQSIDLVVDENGEIGLPLVGRIKAAGLTPSAVSERVQASYVPRYYVRCTATVLATVRFYYVGGELRAPGRMNWTEDISLLKAINTAGGFSEYANRRKVELTRAKAKRVFDCEDLRSHPEKDIPIQPGDSIYVPRSIF